MQTIIFTALITVGLCFAGFVTYGQTFSEWWQQKKTRIKYLRQQAAILGILKETIEKGYEGAEEGVDSVGAIAEEELAQHAQFLKSLPFVKPALKNSPEFLSSHALAQALINQVLRTMKNYSKDAEFTEQDIRWLSAYMIGILKDLRYELEELDLLASDGVVRMKDNERYEKIRAAALNIRITYDAGMAFLLQMDEVLVAMQEKANTDFVKDLLK